MKLKQDLISAVDGIITGKLVNRSAHDLTYDGKNVTRLFLERLSVHGYTPMKVGDAEVEAGYRIPAFVIRDGTAYFGWVFVEQFTEKKSRKLFGSVVRNRKGDWSIQIPHNSQEIVYANCGEKVEMENERLFIME